MSDPKRLSPATWSGKTRQAAAMRIVVCAERAGDKPPLIGIDMLAQDDRAFGHGHMEIGIAEKFWRLLGDAIVEARGR